MVFNLEIYVHTINNSHIHTVRMRDGDASICKFLFKVLYCRLFYMNHIQNFLLLLLSHRIKYESTTNHPLRLEKSNKISLICRFLHWIMKTIDFDHILFERCFFIKGETKGEKVDYKFYKHISSSKNNHYHF